MVVTPHPNDIEGCRRVGCEERFVIDGSNAADTQTGLACQAEHIVRSLYYLSRLALEHCV